jgi:hypothetical protein
LATLDSREDSPPVPAWRPPARRRVTVAALSLLAVGLAIAVVATGPARPLTYDMRLPLLVLACGALGNAVQWRRRVSITPREVTVRTLLRTRRIPLPAVARAETDGCRVTIYSPGGRKAVVRAMTDPSSADDLAIAIANAAGPLAYVAAHVPSVPVPMATPWLIMLSTVAVALLTAKGFAADPALVTAALGAGTVICCMALGSSFLHDRRERATEPGS